MEPIKRNRGIGLQTILNAKGANGVGTATNVQNFKNIIIQLATASNAALTVKIQASISAAAPDFSAAASPSNHWTYIQVVDLISNLPIIGGTGITASGTDLFQLLELDVNGIRWINMEVSSWTVGTITTKILPLTNQ